MTSRRVLVAGIGNALFGDDGFGLAVAEALGDRLGEGVEVRAFGVRAIDLAHALMDGPEHAILLDAMRRGGAPGTLYVIEPTLDARATGAPQTHGLDPVRVLAMVRAATGRLPRLHVVGCEPSRLEEMHIGLSPEVAAAVEPACELVDALVRDPTGASLGILDARGP